jgi:hypothetical protein
VSNHYRLYCTHCDLAGDALLTVGGTNPGEAGARWQQLVPALRAMSRAVALLPADTDLSLTIPGLAGVHEAIAFCGGHHPIDVCLVIDAYGRYFTFDGRAVMIERDATGRPERLIIATASGV